MSRRTARKHAFELVYELPFHDKEDLDFLIGCHLSDKTSRKMNRNSYGVSAPVSQKTSRPSTG